VRQALLDGSQPRKLNEKLDPRLFKALISLHPDGRRIAFTPAAATGGQMYPLQVWALENFLPGK
jgi:Tol biopolymer transport system component